MIAAFEREETVHGLDRAITVIGHPPISIYLWIFSPLFDLGPPFLISWFLHRR
jgi:hypothetical protein